MSRFAHAVLATITLGMLAACNVDVQTDHTADLSELASKAQQVCGAGNVAEVNVDGFRCKDDADHARD